MLEINQTSRNDFNDTWLVEMPSGLGSFEIFDALEYSIKDLLQAGIEKMPVKDNIYKIELPNSVYYWYEINGTIALGSELHKKPQGLIVSITAKNPIFRNKPPYASELYKIILNDTPSNIRILSDTQLSDEGFSIWKKLLNQGLKISVYDKLNPGKTFKTFDNEIDMDEYFKHDDDDFKRYQYVISETILQLAECKSFFNTRRYRELAGLSLED